MYRLKYNILIKAIFKKLSLFLRLVQAKRNIVDVSKFLINELFNFWAHRVIIRNHFLTFIGLFENNNSETYAQRQQNLLQKPEYQYDQQQLEKNQRKERVRIRAGKATNKSA